MIMNVALAVKRESTDDGTDATKRRRVDTTPKLEVESGIDCENLVHMKQGGNNSSRGEAKHQKKKRKSSNRQSPSTSVEAHSRHELMDLLHGISSVSTKVALPALRALLEWVKESGRLASTEPKQIDGVDECPNGGPSPTTVGGDDRVSTASNVFHWCRTYAAVPYLLDCISDHSLPERLSSRKMKKAGSAVELSSKKMKKAGSAVKLSSKILQHLLSLCDDDEENSESLKRHELASDMIGQLLDQEGVSTILSAVESRLRCFVARQKVKLHQQQHEIDDKLTLKTQHVLCSLWNVLLSTVGSCPMVLTRCRQHDKARMVDVILESLAAARRYGMHELIGTLLGTLNNLAMSDDSVNHNNSDNNNDKGPVCDRAPSIPKLVWSVSVDSMTSSASPRTKSGVAGPAQKLFVLKNVLQRALKALFLDSVSDNRESVDADTDDSVASLLDHPDTMARIFVFVSNVEDTWVATSVYKSLLPICMDALQRYPENQNVLGSGTKFLVKACPKIKDEVFLRDEGVLTVLSRIQEAAGAKFQLHEDILGAVRRTAQLILDEPDA